MWNPPSIDRLAAIPRLYATEHIPLADKLIHLHMFIGQCDWFIAEFDGADTLWGFVILNADYFNAEWGYVSLAELKAIRIGWTQIDCELLSAWRIRLAMEVEKIRLAHGWTLPKRAII